MVKKLTIDSRDFVRSMVPLLDGVLFSSLQAVVLNGFIKEHGNVVKMLPNCLRTLQADGVNEHVILHLLESCDSLQTLSLRGDCMHDATCVRLTEMHALSQVSLSVPYSGMLIPSLAICPCLRVIDLELADAIEYLPTMPTRRAFPALRSLTMSGQSSAGLARCILQSLRRDHPMEAISIRGAVHLSPDWDDFMDILTVIEYRCDPLALHTLVIMPSPGSEPVLSGEEEPDALYIKPLARFSQLTKLSLASYDGLALVDADCVTAAGGWPSMRALWLCDLRAEVQLLSLFALVPFAESCPDLVELALVFDARNNPPRLSNYRPRYRSRLTTLIVCNSPIDSENVGPVARFLAMLFPRLSSITCAESPYARLWTDVCNRVKNTPERPDKPGPVAASLRDDEYPGRTSLTEVQDVNMEDHWPKSDAHNGATASNTVPPRAVETAEDQSQALAQRVADLERVNSQLEQRNTALEKSRGKLERRYRTLEDRLEQKTRDLDSKAKTGHRIPDLARRYEDLEQSSDAQGKQILRLEREVRDLSQSKADILQQKTDIMRRCDDLERRTDEQTKYILQLERGVRPEPQQSAGSSANSESLAAQLSTVKQEKDQLQARYNALLKHAREVVTRNGDLQKHERERDQQRQQLERRCADLTKWQADMQQSLRDLASRGV
ncbi:hypothetical protein BD626DRAFT_573737 [Schizophyllum amplum]|uniref:Uncharacterized protein n=1 Tax=Schizophyllum amplum TaxID=97359 RepID=A0A550C0I1_9AGAR|nr:hypothetical protein BD626DRAFT_573737 [Auriculariopsis ampla]